MSPKRSVMTTSKVISGASSTFLELDFKINNCRYCDSPVKSIKFIKGRDGRKARYLQLQCVSCFATGPKEEFLKGEKNGDDDVKLRAIKVWNGDEE